MSEQEEENRQTLIAMLAQAVHYALDYPEQDHE